MLEYTYVKVVLFTVKAKEVLDLLKITRQTLSNYVQSGIIKVTILPNGRYDYSKEDVYAFVNKTANKKTCIYARVSDSSQKHELEQQVEAARLFSHANGYVVSDVFTDIASDTDYENRDDFFRLLSQVFSNTVERIVVTENDKICVSGYTLLLSILKNYSCEIICLNQDDFTKTRRKDV